MTTPSPTADNPRITNAIALTLTLLTLLVFWPVTTFEFINFDDDEFVTENPNVLGGLSPQGIVWAFTTTSSDYWRPLSWISHMLDVSLFGLNAGGHHLTSLLFHLLNTLLVFAVFRRMTGHLWRSAMVAALFAWHPLHVESVAWIAERKDVMCATFFLLTLGAYTRYREAATRKWYALALAGFCLALMCKPMAVTLPCVLLLLDRWPFRRSLAGNPTQSGQRPACPTSLRNLILEKIPFFALAASAGVLAIIAQRQVGTMTDIDHLPIHFRIANALVAYTTYLHQTVWPANLTVFYPLPQTIPTTPAILSALLLVTLSLLILKLASRHPAALTGWLWYLGILAPVIGLIQVGTQAYADRYTYLPLIGIFLAAVWFFAELPVARRIPVRITAGLATLILLACLATTRRQLSHWQSNETLFNHALAVNPNNYFAHYNLGTALAEKNLLKPAIHHFTETIRIYPIHAKAHNNLGSLLTTMGQLEKALAHFRTATAIDPTLGEAFYNLGATLARIGRLNEALAPLASAAKLRPNDGNVQFQIGSIFATQQNAAEALQAFALAIRLAPDNPAPPARMAWILATHPDPRFRDGPRAVHFATKATELTANQQPLTLDALAAALAETGDFPAAVRIAATAADLASKAGNIHLAQAVTNRIQLYRSHQPYRENLR